MNTKLVTEKVEPGNTRLPTLEIDGYHLLSGVAQHLETPETFPIPSEYERSNIPIGAYAKLVFEIATPLPKATSNTFTERMWVFVLERAGEHYVGQLRNVPVCSHVQDKLHAGDTVVFLPEHVIEILDQEGLRKRMEKYKSGAPLPVLKRQDCNTENVAAHFGCKLISETSASGDDNDHAIYHPVYFEFSAPTKKAGLHCQDTLAALGFPRGRLWKDPDTGEWMISLIVDFKLGNDLNALVKYLHMWAGPNGASFEDCRSDVDDDDYDFVFGKPAPEESSSSD